MTTRREIITKIYLRFENEVKQITTKKFLPSLEDTDLGLLLIDLEMYFPTCSDYTPRIVELLELSDIDLPFSELDQLIVICNRYLKEIKNLINKI